MPEMPSNHNDRPLTRAEKDEVACEWSDYRSAYGTSRMHAAAQHQAFMAGWTARHLHGYAADVATAKEQG